MWYFERCGLINVLIEAQRRQFVGLTRLVEADREAIRIRDRAALRQVTQSITA